MTFKIYFWDMSKYLGSDLVPVLFESRIRIRNSFRSRIRIINNPIHNTSTRVSSHTGVPLCYQKLCETEQHLITGNFIQT
jgi:hypothetical protein